MKNCVRTAIPYTTQQELEGDVESIKESLNFVNINTEEVENLRKSNDVRILGVNETQGEDCLAITMDFISSLGFEDAAAEVENAHRTGKKEITNLGILLLSFIVGPSRKK